MGIVSIYLYFVYIFLLLIYILWERCLIIHYWFYWVKSKRKKEILSSHRQSLFIQPPVSRTGRKEWTDLLKAIWESKSEISEIKHACCYHCLKWCMEESTLPKLSNHLLKQLKRLNIHLQNIWQKCELAKCSQNSLLHRNLWGWNQGWARRLGPNQQTQKKTLPLAQVGQTLQSATFQHLPQSK